MDVPKDLMASYLERREKDLESCAEWLSKGLFTEIEKVGHQLKGNGATFGFPELSSIGKSLELAARDGDESSMKDAIQRLGNWIDNFH